jgi:Spy/CpxP family protein refolding chaperone
VNRWRIILAAAVIFCAGAGTGAIVARNYAPKIVKRTHVSPPLPLSHDRREEYISKLDREVQLTAEQRGQVERILAASQKRMKQIWEPLEPEVKEEYRRTRREISEILTPEQQAKMSKWKKDNGKKDQKPNETGQSPGEGSEKQKCCVKDALDFCF